MEKTEKVAFADKQMVGNLVDFGYRADIVMIDLNAINNKPCFDTYCTLSYSANSSNVLLTMVDGDILYQNGEFTTIDIERAIYDFDEICKHYFD